MSDRLITLGIESSCDDTSAAVLRGDRELLANVVSSQTVLHGPYGGVVPELASRAHIQQIGPVVDEALRRAGVRLADIGLVAVTAGPGLIGSLLVGVNYAKSLAWTLGIPLMAVNHLEGHFFSACLEHPEPVYPAVGLIASGGHTSIHYAATPGQFDVLADTRDDAAGEAFDKAAKVLGLPYPGGPVIDRIAREYDGPAVRFGLPRISDGSIDFSFSGLKTALLYRARELPAEPAVPGSPPPEAVRALLKGFQQAVVNQLLHRLRRVCRQRPVHTLLFGGGVACNSELRRRAADLAGELGLPARFPSPALTTDNAAMIAWAGRRRHLAGTRTPPDFNARSVWRLGDESPYSPTPA